jgi:uncharacterized membrane protein YeiH
MLYALDLFGVVVFAIAGVLVAARKQMDVFGLVVVALVTALGGGTLRDLCLGARPVFWATDPTYVLVATAAALGTFGAERAAHAWGAAASRAGGHLRALLVADAFGLAIFTVIGTEKALQAEVSPAIAAILGTMTGVAGGMVRDVLCGEIPLILRKEIYATASLLGAAILVALCHLGLHRNLAILLAVAAVLVLRLAAIRWRLALPTLAPQPPHDDAR